MNWSNRFAVRTGQMQRSAVRELLKVTARPEILSFAGGLPAADLFPAQGIQRIATEVLERNPAAALQYGETEGVAGLRDWIAQRASRPGLAVGREHVLVTHGAQQGLDLLGRVLVDEGVGVAVENPTYLAFLTAWRPYGARFVPVPIDAVGMHVETLAALPAESVRLVYVIPDFQNPTGATLSLERRQQLLELAEARDWIVIEDTAYSALRFEGVALPSLLELSGGLSGPGRAGPGRVIQVGTVSKVLAPGLRVGWVIGAAELMERLVRAKQSCDLHTSTFNQQIALGAGESGLLDTQLPRLVSAYRSRRDTMLRALGRHLGPGTRWTHPAGGLFVFVTLPAGIDARLLLDRCLREGVAFVPGGEFHVDGSGLNTLRLNYSHAGEAAIEEGIRRLAMALDEVQRL